MLAGKATNEDHVETIAKGALNGDNTEVDGGGDNAAVEIDGGGDNAAVEIDGGGDNADVEVDGGGENAAVEIDGCGDNADVEVDGGGENAVVGSSSESPEDLAETVKGWFPKNYLLAHHLKEGLMAMLQSLELGREYKLFEKRKWVYGNLFKTVGRMQKYFFLVRCFTHITNGHDHNLFVAVEVEPSAGSDRWQTGRRFNTIEMKLTSNVYFCESDSFDLVRDEFSNWRIEPKEGFPQPWKNNGKTDIWANHKIQPHSKYTLKFEAWSESAIIACKTGTSQKKKKPRVRVPSVTENQWNKPLTTGNTAAVAPPPPKQDTSDVEDHVRKWAQAHKIRDQELIANVIAMADVPEDFVHLSKEDFEALIPKNMKPLPKKKVLDPKIKCWESLKPQNSL